MNSGSKAVKTSAIFLFLLSMYELYSRIDASIKPLLMFYNMWIGEGISFQRGLQYVDFTILHLPLYLFGCVIFSLFSFFSRSTRVRSFIYFLFSLGLIYIGTLFRPLLFPHLWMFLKLLPLILLSAGHFFGILAGKAALLKKENPQTMRGQTNNPAQHSYNPFGLERTTKKDP